MCPNIFPYLFPVLALAIAVVLLCFYLRFKRKRLTYGVATPTAQDGDTSLVLRTISYPEVQAEEDRYGEVFPPQYSDVDHPPPYSLFDPKLTSIWPGDPPPAYEMYPITLPLAPHHWMTPTGPPHPSPSSSPGSHPSRPQQTATG